MGRAGHGASGAWGERGMGRAGHGDIILAQTEAHFHIQECPALSWQPNAEQHEFKQIHIS